MTPRNLNGEDGLNRAMQHSFDVPMSAKVQARLAETYASLREVPQECADSSAGQDPVSAAVETGFQPYAASTAGQSGSNRESVRHAAPTRRTTPQHDAKKGARVMRRGVVIAAAAALVVLFGGTAFAVSSLLQMQARDVPFFQNGSNLSVYNSLQAGISSLNTEVGQSAMIDGMTVTLDTVSTDRNIVNLFFTLEKEGGFNLDAEAFYEGSNESEWMRLQQIVPRFMQAHITSAGELLCKNDVNLLDAYREEDGKVKCLMRIVPSVVLPNEVTISLVDMVPPEVEGGQYVERTVYDVGLDLGTVAQPADLGAQDITFQTSDGEKTLGIKRFTHSELGTVFIVRNDEAETIEESGRPMYHPAENALMPQNLKITDGQGNVLHYVGAGDGMGINPAADYVMELSGMASDATSVSFTPMMSSVKTTMGEDGRPTQETQDAWAALKEANPFQEVDVSQIGTQLPTSEYGGYEITNWTVENNTVSIALKPYGWVPGAMYGGPLRLAPTEQPTLLKSEYVDETTGETYGGYHTGVAYDKYDYLSGELVLMTSYYAATNEELQGLRTYRYNTLFGYYLEEAAAAQTCTFPQV